MKKGKDQRLLRALLRWLSDDDANDMIAVASNSRRVRRIEGVIFWLLRLATYFILACATYIFLDIGIKGSRTVFTKTAPFINLKFLTTGPQTLYRLD